MKTPRDDTTLRRPSFIAQVTRGIVRDQRMRRKMMSALLAVAVLLLVAGTTVLQDVINPREHVVRFIFYWFVCGWLTLTALLLALFDILFVRAQARALRRDLREGVAPTAPSAESKSRE